MSFTNDIGQKINEGDDVLIVTTSTHRVNTRRGVFVGMCGNRVQVKSMLEQYNYAKRKYVEVEKITTLNANMIYKLGN